MNSVKKKKNYTEIPAQELCLYNIRQMMKKEDEADDKLEREVPQ